MKLSELKPAKGSVKNRKRIARGQGSGHGGTSTRGHKGAKSRSGFKNKRNFEGGQMPLQMRIPKRGFKSPNRIAYTVLNLKRLDEIAEKFGVTTIDLEFLITNNIVSSTDRVKILANGEVSKSLQVSAHAASEKAISSIETKGGSVNLIK
jgi:large subunit ribosomal protein L15